LGRRISVLARDVVDQIAAGEVLERPAHLVKELIENSIDAGSRRIEIEASDGGRHVLVVDDGCGIDGGDLGEALTRFATSKIRSADELWALRTYGFRGEALASAAAVSQLSLTSRTLGSKTAHGIQSRFGEVSSVSVAAGSPGTRVEVSELFANTPVRLKFLRSEASEHGQIRTVVRALALANESIHFSLKLRGKVDLELPPSSFVTRAQQVLGAKSLFLAESPAEQGWRAEIAFASPHEVVGQSRQIWILVQGRWVQDRGLQQAVIEAYRNLLMHGEFPQVVVRLTCPPESVDVNVHPTKSQVKFADPASAWRLVNQTLRRALESAPWQSSSSSLAHGDRESLNQDQPRPAPRLEDFQRRWTAQEAAEFDITSLKSLRMDRQEPQSEPVPAVGYWARGQIIGQAAQKYIIMQRDGTLLLIDQHAAHERVLFERLMQQWRDGSLGETQNMLLPLSVQLEPDELEVVIKWSDDLRRLGLHLDAVGPQTIAVRAMPTLLSESAVVEVIRRTARLEDGAGIGGSRLEEQVRELCALMACHSAVRAGQTMSEMQMRELVSQMDEHPLSGFCPHGRPVSVEWALTELDRQFGRLG
jgi:DNA mismatch repair protein MutL